MKRLWKLLKSIFGKHPQQWPPADRSNVQISNCPQCNGKIERKQGSNSWVCIGLDTREEVIAALPKAPDSVTSIAPCGWHGLHSDFGKTWE